MSSTLKQELKAWEAAFRTEHGRDPTKQDIKQNAEIAHKYKEYNKSKQVTAPIPSNVFKTPTKSRNSRKQTTSTTTTRDLHGDNPFNASSDASTSTGTKASSNSAAKANGTQYVLANSPSKLRALAAMHSTTGSPNRPSGPNWMDATASTSSTFSSKASTSRHSKSTSSSSKNDALPPPTDFNRSPRKALNPFASPKKKEFVTIQPPSRGTTLFGDFEKLEREKLKKKKSRVKVKSGLGWGHASDVLDTFGGGGGGRGESEKMEVDEVDDFFGGGGGNSAKKRNGTTTTTNTTGSLTPSILSPSKFATNKPSNPFLPSQPLQESNNDGEEDDEMLGPSPVKSSSFQRTSSFGFDLSKPFKPLFEDAPAPSAPSSSAVPAASRDSSSKPKLFATSLRTNSVPPEDSASSRGMKRTTSRTTINGKGKGKVKDEMDALLEDGDDDFYADALDAVEKEIEGNAVGNRGKRKRMTANGRGRGKGKVTGKGREREDNEGDGHDQDDDELRVEKDDRGGLILDLRVDGHLQGEEGESRERILVHRQGRDTKRRRDRRADQNGRESKDGSDEDDFDRDEVSLLDRPQARAIVSSRPQSDNSSNQQSSSNNHASLPSELASILSLRASPQKSSTTAKERQIAKLLGEPTAFARQRRRGGLLELADELAEEEWDDSAGVGSEREGDDDWDEEVDGWKQTGEAMDGYYSGGEEW
ncbi:hypothetical protein JCM3765_000120 [Sporobolomyces pararoseus]